MMKMLGLIKKTLIENIRDWKILILTLIFAPFFLWLMYLYFDSESVTTYKIGILNRDTGITAGSGRTEYMGTELVSKLKNLSSGDGKPILDIREDKSEELLLKKLRQHGIDLMISIPGNFSTVLSRSRQGEKGIQTNIQTMGDPANGKYMMAAIWCDMTTYQYAEEISGIRGPIHLDVRTIGGQAVTTLSDFQLYIPGMLVMALIMIMFTAAASLIKEKDTGTIIRLRLSGLPPVYWYASVTIIQLVIGLAAMALTVLTAIALGYQISASMTALVAVGFLTSLAVMGISLVVSAYLRTIFDLMTIGCFPFFILIFFSGAMFPLPRLQVCHLWNHPLHINDILPVTHAITALGKILNQHETLGDILFELGAITILTIILFAWGSWLFTRRHLRPH